MTPGTALILGKIGNLVIFNLICHRGRILYKEVKTMTTSISGITAIGADLYSHNTETQPETTPKIHSSDPKTVGIHFEGDQVDLSSCAKALQLKEQGKPVDEIAKLLNLDVKTVENFLANEHVTTATQALQMKEEGKSITQIANSLNLDEKIVNLYLGIAPTPANIQAQQMKEQGKSVADIAYSLNLDVKTVNLYLGIASESAE